MAEASGAHIARANELFGHRIVNLGTIVVMATSNQDLAIGEEGRGVAGPWLLHPWSGREGAAQRVIKFGSIGRRTSGIRTATSDQHAAVKQQGRRVIDPVLLHGAGQTEFACGHVIDLRLIRATTRNQNLAVGEQGGSLPIALYGYRAGWFKGAFGGIIELGRVGATADDQDLAVSQQHRRGGVARRHHVGSFCETAAYRVEELRRRENPWHGWPGHRGHKQRVHPTNNQDLAIRQNGGGVTAAAGAHRVRKRSESAFRQVDFGAREYSGRFATWDLQHSGATNYQGDRAARSGARGQWLGA